MAREYGYEDRIKIEDALKKLQEILYSEVGAAFSNIKIFDNGDIEGSFMVSGEGSTMKMEITNGGSRVVCEHLYSADVPFTESVGG